MYMTCFIISVERGHCRSKVWP